MDEQVSQQMAAQLRKPEGEEGRQTGEWMNRGNDRMNRDVLQVLDAAENDTILEIGMGNGFFVEEILSRHPTITYTGCDFSDVMVEEAKRINATGVANGRAGFMHADIVSFEAKEKLFTKIFTANTIYFWEDPKQVLDKIKTLLAPNGKLIIGLRPKHLMQGYPFTKYGFTMYSKQEVSTLLEENGFVVSRVFENQEPDIELHGEIVKIANMVVVAHKKA